MEARVTVVEHEVGQLREEWKVFQQGQGRVLTALRETQLEHGRDIAVLKTDVAELRLGQHTIISMLDQLIAREN